MVDNPEPGAPPPAWKRLRFEAAAASSDEPALASYLNAAILSHHTLCQAMSYHLAEKLGDSMVGTQQVRDILFDVYQTDPSIVAAAEADMLAVLERDPA